MSCETNLNANFFYPGVLCAKEKTQHSNPVHIFIAMQYFSRFSCCSCYVSIVLLAGSIQGINRRTVSAAESRLLPAVSPASLGDDSASIKQAFSQVGPDAAKQQNFIDFHNFTDPCGPAVCLDRELHIPYAYYNVTAGTPLCNWPVVACYNNRVEQIVLRTDCAVTHQCGHFKYGNLMPSYLPDTLKVFVIDDQTHWSADDGVLESFPPALESLTLSGMVQNSTITNILHNLTNLRDVKLSDSLFRGSVPFINNTQVRGVSSLTSFIIENIYGMNAASCDLALQLVWYPNLTMLVLSAIKLEGLSSSLVNISEAMPQLEYLDLGNNQFTHITFPSMPATLKVMRLYRKIFL